jgi:large subunit ribosomal protein L3
MLKGILGKKLGMTRIYRDNGVIESVTAVEAGPCTVVQVKTTNKEGYEAIQLGFGESKRLTSPEKGHVKELGNFQHLREFREETKEVKIGDKVDVNIFKAGDHVDVTGLSKGKGFAGVVKRHHFSGGPKTHGQSDRHRHPGAIGSTTTPGRIWKGLRMAGRMGGERVTVRRLEVFQADAERNLLLIKGSVPGIRSGLLLIRKSKEK